MHFKLTVDSFLCVLVITSKISIAKTVIDLSKLHIPNFSQFLPVNFCKPGLKMFKSYIACNGRIDCPDGSDETSHLCQGTKCSNSLFRCNYGACIGRNFVCNGAFDCADGSDEQLDLCTNAQCRVPFATTSTVYYAGDCEGQCGGFLAEDGTILHYVCANNSSDTNFLTTKPICRNGFWRPGIPSCTGGNLEPTKSEMSAANTSSTMPGADMAGSKGANQSMVLIDTPWSDSSGIPTKTKSEKQPDIDLKTSTKNDTTP